VADLNAAVRHTFRAVSPTSLSQMRSPIWGPWASPASGGMTHSRVAEDADVRLTAPFQIEGQHQPNHGSGCVCKCAGRFISTLRGVDAG